MTCDIISYELARSAVGPSFAYALSDLIGPRWVDRFPTGNSSLSCLLQRKNLYMLRSEEFLPANAQWVYVVRT
jgi:hypothetical protein